MLRFQRCLQCVERTQSGRAQLLLNPRSMFYPDCVAVTKSSTEAQDHIGNETLVVIKVSSKKIESRAGSTTMQRCLICLSLRSAMEPSSFGVAT